jgi:hypothetical protein
MPTHALDCGILAIKAADNLDIVFELGRFDSFALRHRYVAFPVLHGIATKRHYFKWTNDTD